MRDDIEKALEVLRNGGVILYPTDTVWGLGCDATNNKAVQRIYDIKKREDNRSMIILVDNPGKMYSYIEDIPEIADQLIDLSEKPLTLILEGAKNLAENIINKLDKSIGIRVVNEAFCKQLIQRFRKPIVSTSANISGESSPTIFNDISESIKQNVDYIVKYRQDDYNKTTPSGIIKIGKNNSIKIIRE